MMAGFLVIYIIIAFLVFYAACEANTDENPLGLALLWPVMFAKSLWKTLLQILKD